MAYQHSFGGFHSDDAVSALSFKSSKLLPRGFDSSQIHNRHYLATSLNYQLPICYPDGGWQGVIYFKRIRLNAGFDAARFQRPVFYEDGSVREMWHNLYSFGGDVILDLNIFSQPSAATTALKLSFYQPSEGGFFVAAGLELPF
jgi:hypothetical protein